MNDPVEETEAQTVGVAAAPLLSICVPAYDRPELLRRALRSVVEASPAEPAQVEMLVSDNSPDVNEQIVRDAMGHWSGPKAYLPNRPDIGAIPNFNQCLERASGRYVLLLHDDDYLVPGSLDAILRVLGDVDETETSLLFGVAIVDIDEHVRRRQDFRAKRRLGPRSALRKLLSDSSFVRMPALVARRDVLLELGGFDPSVGNPADFDLLIRLFASAGVTCLPHTIAAYTVHADAATSTMFNPAMIEQLCELFDRSVATGVLPEAVVRACQRDWFHQFILGGTYRRLRAGETAAARRVFALFELPAIRGLGRSRGWLPVRILFEILLRLPSWIAGPLMRQVGRLRLERIWMPLDPAR